MLVAQLDHPTCMQHYEIISCCEVCGHTDTRTVSLGFEVRGAVAKRTILFCFSGVEGMSMSFVAHVLGRYFLFESNLSLGFIV